jgi:hypothetical protein
MTSLSLHPLEIDKNKMYNVTIHFVLNLEQEEVPVKASVVDMRYKMKEVLSALDRNESIEILYHGKVKGVIKPFVTKVRQSVKEHRFFGMQARKGETVEASMEKLRGQRYK